MKSLLFYVSLLMTSVSGFAPAKVTNQNNIKLIGGDVSTVSIVQPRKNTMHLSAVVEPGTEPLVTSLIVLAGIAGALALNPDEDGESMVNSWKSMIAEADSPVKKEATEKTESTVPVVQKIEVEETKEAKSAPLATEEKSTSVLVKMGVKLVKPWRKFSTI